jgi:hypothetical protein
MTNPSTPHPSNLTAAFTPDQIPPAGEQPHLHPEAGLQALMTDRRHRIQVAAYFLAERRGFAPGHELDDWLAAEDAIDMEDAARAAED